MLSGQQLVIFVITVLTLFRAKDIVEDFDVPEHRDTRLGDYMPPRRWDVRYVQLTERTGDGIWLIHRIPRTRGRWTVLNPSGMVKVANLLATSGVSERPRAGVSYRMPGPTTRDQLDRIVAESDLVLANPPTDHYTSHRKSILPRLCLTGFGHPASESNEGR